MFYMSNKTFCKAAKLFKDVKTYKKSNKIKYKAENDQNSQKGTIQLKKNEKVAKRKRKKKENRKIKRLRQIIDKTQLKTMVGVYNATETGTMKLV